MSGSKLRKQSERFYDLVADASRRVHKDQKVFWVDSNYSGNSAWSGRRLTAALPTLDAAYQKMSASRGDVALISPFHAESIATAFTYSKAYCSFEGLELGNKRPTFTFTAAAGALTFSGANNLLKNLHFTNSGTIDVTAPLTISGDRTKVKNVSMLESATTSQFVFGMLVSGDYCIVDEFNFLGLAGDANVTGLRMSGADGLELKNSRIVGNFQGAEDATGAIQSLTTANLNLDIHDNRVENRDGTSEAGIVFVATDTGFVYRNFIAVPTGDFGQGIVTDTLMRQYDNNVVDVATERGAPEGTASA